MASRIAPAEAPYDERALKCFARLPKDWGEPFLMFRVLARDSRLLERYIGGAASYLDRVPAFDTRNSRFRGSSAAAYGGATFAPRQQRDLRG